MDKLKSSQSWVIGESIVWAIFVIVTAVAGLSMMSIIKLSHAQSAAVGRVALAFSLLAFFYLTFLASKQRSK